MNPKFQVGDLIKESSQPDTKAGIVLSYTCDENGFVYRLTAKEVDLEKTEIINGVKTCHENELELVKTKEQLAAEKEAEDATNAQ